MHATLKIVVLAATCAVTLAGCGTKEVPGPIPEETHAYVALGDSFTALAGTGPFTDQLCNRTADDYPSLVAKKLHLKSFADVSCGGAAPGDLAGSQKIENQGVNQPQLDAVSADTELVTVGIGLNESVTKDGQSSGPIAFLLTELCAPKSVDSDGCKAYLQYGDDLWSEVIDKVGESVAGALGQIRERAPDARIVLVGYPRVLPDAGPCPRVPLPPVAFERLRTTMRETNQRLAQVAEQAGVEYVDMYTPSKGHDACSADPWINGYKDVKGKAFGFHPYRAYHQAVAAKIEALLKTKKPQA